MDEDDADLERAKALSLLTVHEDEKRRKKLYSPEELVPKDVPVSQIQGGECFKSSSSMPEFAFASNLVPRPINRVPSPNPISTGVATISRPRPQPKQKDPRGSPKLSIPGPPKVPPRPDPSFCTAPRKPKETQNDIHHAGVPWGEPVQNASALKLPPPERVVPDRPKDKGLPVNENLRDRASSVPPPSSRSVTEPLGITPTSETSSPVHIRKGKNETDLIMLSPPASSRDPLDFDIFSLDPFRPSPLKGATVGSEVDGKGLPPRPRQKLTLSPPPSTKQVSPPKSADPVLSKNPAYGFVWNPSPVVPPRPKTIHESTNVPTVSGNKDDSIMSLQMLTPSEQPANRPLSNISSDSSGHYTDIVKFQQDGLFPMAENFGNDVGDLMDFRGEDYLSLASFDPLYDIGNVKQRSSSSRKSDGSEESIDLFPASIDVPRKKLAVDETQVGTSNKASTNHGPEASLSREESFAELQDPFSVSDLTITLERKRQKHVVEQEARVEKQKLEEEKRKQNEMEMTLRKKSVAAKEKPNRLIARRNSYIVKGQESSYEMLQPFDETADDEIVSFCQMVGRIKMMYSYEDEKTNQGVVLSARVQHKLYSDLSVKVIVYFKFTADPIVFTCNLTSTVLHVIEHVLLSVTEDLGSICADDYILKVFGLSEYLFNDSRLCEYEYIEECLKLDKDIKLVIDKCGQIPRPFLRTANDDRYAVFVPKPRDVDDNTVRVTRDKLNIVMETYYKEVEKLRDQAIKSGCENVHCKGVIQAVKAICAMLHKIETIDIFKSTQRLSAVVGEACVSSAVGSEEQLNDLHLALEEVTRSVKGLIEMYCRTFHTHFRFESANKVPRAMKEVTQLNESLLFHISTAHRFPLKTRSNFEEYKVICGLYYGGHRLAPDVVTQTRHRRSDGFQDTILWDEWLLFDSILVCNLPRESRLLFTLVGLKTIQHTTNDGTHRVPSMLGWVAMQLFDHGFELVKGSQLLGLWPGNPSPLGTSLSNTDHPNSILLQVNMPDFDFDVEFPAVPEPLPSEEQDFKTLHPSDQEQLMSALDTDAVDSMTCEEMDVIWEKRHFLYRLPEALPLVLRACPCWAWSCLRQMYTMVQQWTSLSPLHSMQLLLSPYPDTYVRNRAVSRITDICADELIDFLPQLVQALKFESYHTSSLARMLLERSVSNVRFAHHLYWLLKEAADDFCYRKRYQLMFGALLSVVGESMRQEFSKQEDAVKMLSAIAEKVKAAKEREVVLQRELGNMWDFLQHDAVRLPLNPAMHIRGVDVKSCSFFTSFTVPLKLVLHNVDMKAEPIYIMFKVGDDLRQDMLTMQLLRVMDRLWLRQGLDLKMITFRCQQTGNKRGMVEIVTESDTLRKIQVKHGHGVAGSFKDRPIHEWLQTQNPTELDYEKAVDNFTSSCAGYCVATYVLGICDRHNDNIMIKQSGHLFHIDFAKFLGDSQMFGTIKRDRTPFVLTSDMAYVINGGDKPSQRFQNFIDQCCRAFNILRQNRRLLVNLFSLMTLSGIPGVTSEAACYVHKALLPDCSDAEATAMFTRMINKSLESSFTQINFFIHNLAQMKFSGHQEGALLSFIPKTYSILTDGKISHVEVFGFQKRYNPEKYYIFIVKVIREGQQVPSFVFRRYSEFQELHHKLVVTFPLIRLPSFSGKVLLGRTHVKTVAETRKSELDTFLKKLLLLAPEISEHDLVYTFFHPMLRDEQDMDKTNLQKLKEPTSPTTPTRVVEGQIKLSLSYKVDTFTVMVMHVKDLAKSSSLEAPDPYVKLYLMPDSQKLTKRKTKIAKSTYHPTYNEMLMYRIPMEILRQRTLQVTVWAYDALKENEFMGAVHIPISDVDLSQEITGWFKFQTLHRMTMAS